MGGPRSPAAAHPPTASYSDRVPTRDQRIRSRDLKSICFRKTLDFRMTRDELLLLLSLSSCYSLVLEPFQRIKHFHECSERIKSRQPFTCYPILSWGSSGCPARVATRGAGMKSAVCFQRLQLQVQFLFIFESWRAILAREKGENFGKFVQLIIRGDWRENKHLI